MASTPIMEPIVLTDPSTGSTARIATHLGFNCYEFQAVVDGHTIDVLDSHPEFLNGNQSLSGSGIPLLFPFPNRIRAGKFDWDGQTYEISPEVAPFDPQGNAIHGFCLDRPWRVIDRNDDFAVGQFQLSVDAPDRLPCWPTDFLIEVRYEFLRQSLRMLVRVVNPGEKPLPWGFGTHPYFRLPFSPDSEPKHCLIEAPASLEWELVDCLPTGKRKPISPEKDLRDGEYFDVLQLDDVLTGLMLDDNDTLESLILDEQAGLQVVQRCDPVFRELVVYTPPDRHAICLEPYTCVTDAVNLQAQGIDTGLHILEPGGQFRAWIELRAERILA